MHLGKFWVQSQGLNCLFTRLLMFKVDFEKTYDAVDWGSSMVVMESMRFLNKWRQWMYECSSMALMCVLVNGSLTGV